ncbi:MAG: DUF4185 domain-containing protein [Deltaproteobacteria bacterium]|nr:DUF4185 domain-containing protein [Deltaproteobacteria bacterium]MBW2392735.1 DUF4185 domain-containing protein [Deltaproteobacteria bacterium]
MRVVYDRFLETGPVFLVLLGVGLFGCLSPVQPPTQSGCEPAFPYQQGWLGGDAAFSVPLDGRRSLWLFGDTFVGEPGQPSRRGARFIHNSIAISKCDDQGQWSIDYRWGAGSDGATAFFDRAEAGKWWWLFDGFSHDGAVYVGLLEVESSAPRGPLAMPFGFTGVELARISNPEEDPSAWQFERLRLSRSPLALPAGAMVVHGAHVYFFTFLDRQARSYPRILVRLPLTSLESGAVDLEPALETLTTDGLWQPGFRPLAARIIMQDDATEMSVHFLASAGVWLALYSYPSVGADFPEQRPSDRVWFRTAESLSGPWSPRRSLFRIPELDPSRVAGFDPHTACYAAKAHPQLSARGSVSFTYVCNLFAGPEGDVEALLGRLVDDLGIYRPIPVSVALPSDLSGEARD